MSFSSHIRSTLFLLFLFGIFSGTAIACSCLPSPTVDEEYTRTDNVIVGKLMGYEEIDRRLNGGELYHWYAALVEVQKVYKGRLVERKTIKVFNGGGGDCSFGFGEAEIGTTYLLYFQNTSRFGRRDASVVGVGLCSRSDRTSDAVLDLRYLDNRTAMIGKSRLSGQLSASSTYGNRFKLPSVSDLDVKIVGSKFTKTIKTEEDGLFEALDIPAGVYKVTFQTPRGWKLRGGSVRPGTASKSRALLLEDELTINVVAGKHVELFAYAEIDNRISGKLVSPTGAPMKGAMVSAYWLTPTSDSFMIPRTETNEKGEFSIKSLPPGKYRIELNNTGRITADNPFETFYYPGVSDIANAETVTVDEGLSVTGLMVKVDKLLPIIRISGKLEFRDGLPVVDEEVRFEPTDDSRYERVEVETDSNGKFSFEIPQGANGTLKANANIWSMDFKQCREALERRKTRNGRAADIQSNVIQLDGMSSLDTADLIYPLKCR